MNPTFKQMLNSVCVWIDSTALSQFIQNAAWVVPTVQIVHILAIAALMASMLMINLRLVGMGARDQTLAQVSRDRKSTRLNSSHIPLSRMPSSA